MQNFSTTENANDTEFPITGEPPNVSATVDTSETSALTEADPIASVPLPAAGSANSVTDNSESLVTKRVWKVKCIEEPVRTSKNNMNSWKPPFEVERGFEGSLREIIRRADYVRTPLQATPVPNGSARYGNTDDLFGRLNEAIAEQAFLPEQTSAMLAYWALSTWFADGLPIAPALVIVAPEFEGDLSLRILRNVCRNPMMLVRAEMSTLLKVNWSNTPTMLFFDPSITKVMATVLGCATNRGYKGGEC
jgi:hypothetical protein